MIVPLYDNLRVYLLMAAFLLVIGIYGLVRRRTLIGMLISGELIFSAASVNLMAFSRQIDLRNIFVVLHADVEHELTRNFA